MASLDVYGSILGVRRGPCVHDEEIPAVVRRASPGRASPSLDSSMILYDSPKSSPQRAPNRQAAHAAVSKEAIASLQCAAELFRRRKRPSCAG